MGQHRLDLNVDDPVTGREEERLRPAVGWCRQAGVASRRAWRISGATPTSRIADSSALRPRVAALTDGRSARCPTTSLAAIDRRLPRSPRHRTNDRCRRAAARPASTPGSRAKAAPPDPTSTSHEMVGKSQRTRRCVSAKTKAAAVDPTSTGGGQWTQRRKTPVLLQCGNLAHAVVAVLPPQCSWRLPREVPRADRRVAHDRPAREADAEVQLLIFSRPLDGRLVPSSELTKEIRAIAAEVHRVHDAPLRSVQ